LEEKSIKTLIVFESLQVGPVHIKYNSIRAPYTITHKDKRQSSSTLIYTFEENVFSPGDAFGQNLASVILAQLALNYGLFCEKIIFDGLFDVADQRFLIDMMENTSREIYIKKILGDNPFLTDMAKGIMPEKRKAYTAASVIFINTLYSSSVIRRKTLESDPNRHVILSSGGKDSLLTYGIIKEINKDPHPVFINESGRHWFTALNTYRYFQKIEKNTCRVWCNSDRIFSWMNTQMPFIRQDFRNIRADDYPIRLWTVAIFLFGAVPLAIKRHAGRLIIGDEYDSTQKNTFRGIPHYNGYYDQSRYFDNTMSRYFHNKGWNISQFSVIRPLSELLIMKILVKRYPELQQHQISCHAAHQKDGRFYPCGYCEKCRRIVGMMKALDENPEHCGYTEEQISHCLQSLANASIHQIGQDAAHLYYLLMERGLLQKNKMTYKMAKPHYNTVKLRFDDFRSAVNDIPEDLRKPLYSIFLNYAESAVVKRGKDWEPVDILNSELIKTPFPFKD
jgi:7-cyano-7-deazaguanine synthase in queuosine biosynthesis